MFSEYSCKGCRAKFNRQGNLTQHLEKSTNLLCINAWRQAELFLRDKKRPILREIPKIDVNNSESEDGDSDLEEDEELEGGFMDLDSIPVEVGAEEEVIEAEMMDVDKDEEDEDNALRPGTAPGGISIESHNRLEAPPVYVTKFGGQAGKPLHTNINRGYSNYTEQLETGSQEIHGRHLHRGWNGKLLSGLKCMDLVRQHLVNFWQ